MASVLKQIAEAVKDELSGATLPLTFEVKRGHAPTFDTTQAEADSVLLYVIGTKRATDLTGGTRNDTADTYTISVGIFAKVGRDDDADIDADRMDELDDFTEKVISHLKSNARLTNYSNAVLTKLDNPAAFDPGMLDEKGTYMTVVSADYLVYDIRF